MAKTCRTCEKSVMEPRCYYHAKRFCYTAEDCPHHGQRETPLLVDALAETGRDLVRELSDWLIDEARPVWGYTNAGCVVTKRDRLNVVLARYKEEVGDA